MIRPSLVARAVALHLALWNAPKGSDLRAYLSFDEGRLLAQLTAEENALRLAAIERAKQARAERWARENAALGRRAA